MIANVREFIRRLSLLMPAKRASDDFEEQLRKVKALINTPPEELDNLAAVLQRRAGTSD